jgi:hypothetical protein
MSTTENAAAPLKAIYNPRRALEHLQTVQGIKPVRLFGIFFPLWDIETTAIQRDGRPYELIEKYIERGIDEGELHTVEDLTHFFGLQREIVTKVLNFLYTLGHVTWTGTGWELTPLGQASVREGTRYVNKEKRTRLYFDAFSLQPLQKAHYNKRVKILDEYEKNQVIDQKTWGYRFWAVPSIRPWQPAALQALANRADREDYNMPWEMKNIQVLSVNYAYIPMYIIESRRQAASTSTQRQQQPYYLVYSGIQDLRDTYFERIVNNNQTLYAALASEQERDQYALWQKWLQERGISEVWPQERADGCWRVSLPVWAFEGAQAKFAVARIGDYELRQGYFVQIWCEEEPLRRKAALDRTLQMVRKQRKYIKKPAIQEHLQLLSRLLQTQSQLSLAELRQRALEVGMKDVIKVLETV